MDVSTCALDGYCGAMVAPSLKHPEGSPGRDPDGFPGKVANAACPVWLIEMSDDKGDREWVGGEGVGRHP